MACRVLSRSLAATALRAPAACGSQAVTPPKELCVEVRVVEDCGEIMTDNGEVHLERGTTHFLRRADVEHLIRQGKLQQLDV